MTEELNLYVSLDGDDYRGDGLSPDKRENSGPFASLGRAFILLEERKRQGQVPAKTNIFMRGGTYAIEKPITIAAKQSLPATILPYQDEKVLISGGKVINNWQETTHKGQRAWVCHIDEVKEDHWHFLSLYVNNQRRERPRLPKKGLTRMTEVPGMPLPNGWSREGYDRFKLEAGVMKTYSNIEDIDVMAFHFWICDRLPVAAFDEESGMIQAQVKSRAPLVEAWGSDLAPCYL